MLPATPQSRYITSTVFLLVAAAKSPQTSHVRRATLPFRNAGVPPALLTHSGSHDDGLIFVGIWSQ